MALPSFPVLETRVQGPSAQRNNSAFSFHGFPGACESLDDQEAALALSFIDLLYHFWVEASPC